jgi:fatty-acyl-CoA synthase
MMGHPAVFEAAVVVVPDEKWQERPLCCVVLRPSETATVEELRAFLAERVAKWWLPERWAFIEAVPKTSVGKFDKKVLRAQYHNDELEIIELS